MNNITSHRYLTMDVFSERVLQGNPLAVFPDASGISDITMQQIALELNLAETVFVGPATRPDCRSKLILCATPTSVRNWRDLFAFE